MGRCRRRQPEKPSREDLDLLLEDRAPSVKGLGFGLACWDNGKENGNYYNGLCWDNGKENGENGGNFAADAFTEGFSAMEAGSVGRFGSY